MRISEQKKLAWLSHGITITAIILISFLAISREIDAQSSSNIWKIVYSSSRNYPDTYLNLYSTVLNSGVIVQLTNDALDYSRLDLSPSGMCQGL